MRLLLDKHVNEASEVIKGYLLSEIGIEIAEDKEYSFA